MKPDGDFSVLIVYDDLPAGMRAKELVGYLSRQLTPGIDLQINIWKFDCLGHPKLRKALCTDAAEADMLIIASGAAELPARVQDWLDRCLSEKGDSRTALVALPELDPPGAVAPFCAGLRAMAERRQVSFFCPQPGRPRRDARYEFATVQPAVESIPITWEEVWCPEADCREWGIND